MSGIGNASRLAALALVAVTVASASTLAAASPNATTTHSVKVYLFRGEKLVPVHRDTTVTGLQFASAAMKALLAGPSPGERRAGLTSMIPAGTTLNRVTISNKTADVDMSSRYASGGGSVSMRGRVAQVVFTLTQFSTVHGVTFRLNGKRVTALGGEGLVLDRPQTRRGYTSFLPPIFIDSPARGESVSSPVLVTGWANVFEGQFRLEVRTANGAVLVRRSAHAAMGHYAPFTVSLSFSGPAGPGKIVGYAQSAKDGSRIDVNAVPVTLG